MACREVQEEFFVIVDSGCSNHMVNTYEYLTDFEVFGSPSQYVHVANGVRVPIVGAGTCGVLGRVLYVPALSHNLPSPRMLDKAGYSTTFVDGSCRITNRT